jgi:hypothetical protein
MSTTLLPYIVTVEWNTEPSPPGVSAFRELSVVVTDSTGVAQPPVILDGGEIPTPWSFEAQVAPGQGEIVVTALDVNGVVIGTPLKVSFAAGGPATYPKPTSIKFLQAPQ